MRLLPPSYSELGISSMTFGWNKWHFPSVCFRNCIRAKLLFSSMKSVSNITRFCSGFIEVPRVLYYNSRWNRSKNTCRYFSGQGQYMWNFNVPIRLYLKHLSAHFGRMGFSCVQRLFSGGFDILVQFHFQGTFFVGFSCGHGRFCKCVFFLVPRALVL